MIDRYIIKMAPAMRHKEVVKQIAALAGLLPSRPTNYPE
jgi:hypothetical protein